jgi:AraC family transcriptional activator of pobA
MEVSELSGGLTAVEWNFGHPRRRRAAHGLLLVSGRGIIDVGDTHTAIEAPTVVWLPSGLGGDIRLGAGTRGAVMTVSEGVLGRVLPASSLAGPLRDAIDRPLLGVPLEAALARNLLADFRAMQQEQLEDQPGMREAMFSRLCLILIAFWRLGGGGAAAPQSSPRQLVRGFLQLVELNARQQWRVVDYARAMGITTERLSTAVRRATGVTPLELVHRRLTEDAEALLERSTMQVSEIADALGFRDAGYFNRFFSRRKGVAPGRFRQQALRRQEGPDASYAAWP